MSASKEAAPRGGRAGISTTHANVYKHPILKQHKACRPGDSRARYFGSSSCLCISQGLPVRELLQLQFKIVRDKSIKEAMLFGLYFAVFLLVAFQVRRMVQYHAF
jgi:hypothetical protein